MCVRVALASRCLQLVVYYIPIIRAHFETKLQSKQFSILRHFDHITKVISRHGHDPIHTDTHTLSHSWFVLPSVCFQDYNDHIAEVSAKLVAIMDSLFEKVLSKVRRAREP